MDIEFRDIIPYQLHGMNVTICSGQSGCGAVIWRRHREDHKAFHEAIEGRRGRA